MHKSDLVGVVVGKTNLPKKDVEKTINEVFDSISDALSNGEKVQLIGFGTFETRERKEREGRNPSTGETIKIPKATVPTFKPGKALKEKVD